MRKRRFNLAVSWKLLRSLGQNRAFSPAHPSLKTDLEVEAAPDGNRRAGIVDELDVVRLE